MWATRRWPSLQSLMMARFACGFADRWRIDYGSSALLA
jgi:hypothetical protein